MDDMAHRIQRRRGELNISQETLAKRVGVQRQSVANWEAGSVPRRETLARLARALGVDAEWLLAGVEPVGTRLMPVKGEVAAGTWKEALDVDLEPIPVAPLREYPAPAQYGLLVRGTSIDKVATDGEYLIVVDVMSAGITPRAGDIVVVHRTRHGVTEASAKRLEGRPGRWQLRYESNSPQYNGTMSLGPTDEGTEIAISAVVVGKYTPISRGPT